MVVGKSFTILMGRVDLPLMPAMNYASTLIDTTFQPGGDKNLPSYKCQDYQKQIAVWQRLKAISEASWLEYDSDGRIKDTQATRQYLSKFTAEDDATYRDRLNLTPFEDKFKQVLQELNALMFSGGVEKVNLPFELYHSQEETDSLGISPYWDNIDGHGLSGDLFLYAVCEDALRDGHTFIFVDYTPLPPARTLAEYKLIERRPYWVHVDAADVVNWRVVEDAGRDRLVRVTICEHSLEPDGEYGEKNVTRYRVYRLEQSEQGAFYVEWVLYEQFDPFSANGSTAPSNNAAYQKTVEVDRGQLLLPFIPLYPVYAVKPIKWGVTKPPLCAIAELNLQHYRDSSDYNYKHHLCNVDMLELVSDQGMSPPEAIEIAPGRTLPYGFRGRWVSPDPTTLNVTRQKIRDTEEKIAFIQADYLKKPVERQTAFTTSVQLGSLDSKLEMSASFFCLSMSNVLRATANYLGYEQGGYLVVNPDVAKTQTADPQMVQLYKNLRDDGFISDLSLRNIYKEIGTFPEWYSMEKEQEQIAAETQQMALQPKPFTPDAALMKSISELALKDIVDKRTALLILQAAGSLPPDVTVDDVILRSGEEIALTAIGSFGVAPADPNKPAGVDLDPNRLLTAYTVLTRAGSPVAEELKQTLNKYLLTSATEIGRRHGSPKTDPTTKEAQ